MIKFTYDNFDLLMTACKNFAVDNNIRPMFSWIRCEVENKVVTAQALDGIKMIKVVVPCVEGEDGVMFLPCVKPIGKKNVFAVVTEDEREVCIETVSGKTTYRKLTGYYQDFSAKLVPKNAPESVCYIDPANLANALLAFKDSKAVKLLFYGDKEGFVIETARKTALVLPLNPKQYNR